MIEDTTPTPNTTDSNETDAHFDKGDVFKGASIEPRLTTTVRQEWSPRDAAASARRLGDSSDTAPTEKTYVPSDQRYADDAEKDHSSFRFTKRNVLAGAALLTAGGLVVAPTIVHDINQANAETSLTAEQTHDANVLKEIQTKALAKVDPADVAQVFDITKANTLYSLSIDLADSQPEFKDADQKTKDWINHTIAESSKAQGSYDVGDAFAITHAEIDGRKTLIVQDGSDLPLVDTSDATTSGTIPSPETH